MKELNYIHTHTAFFFKYTSCIMSELVFSVYSHSVGQITTLSVAVPTFRLNIYYF